jgi:hypothetical protein
MKNLINFRKAFDFASDKAKFSGGEASASVKGAVGTSVIVTPEGWGVKYHATVVAFFPNLGYPKFDSGGFYTPTTARRMNQALQLAGSEWTVRRDRGDFVVTLRNSAVHGNTSEGRFTNKY